MTLGPRRLLRPIRRLLGLDPVDRRLVAEAWLRLVVVTAALRWAGYRRVARWAAVGDPRSIQAADLTSAQRHARWISSASRWQPLRALCLAQSLTLHTWLRSKGVPSELRIGVSKADTQLAAHAWVELGGIPVNDTPGAVAAFTPLEQLHAAMADPRPRTAPHVAAGLR